MSADKKVETVAIIYSVVFIRAYSELQNLLFASWLETVDDQLLLYKLLLMLAFANVYGVTFCAIIKGWKLSNWRTIMKNNLLGWTVLLVCTTAFLVLMAEAYKHMGSSIEAVRVIAAATVIFIPNMWALTQFIGERKN